MSEPRDRTMTPFHLDTLAIHAGHVPDPTTGAVSPPLHLSTTYERDENGNLRGEFLYTRTGNPNRHGLEVCLAALDGGIGAAAFSSGSAAATAVFQSLGAGAHIVAPQDIYFSFLVLLERVFGAWNLEVSTVDMTQAEQVAAAIRPNTRLLWVETPSNPLLKVTNIAAVTEIARRASVFVIADNTFATPLLQRPFLHGVDAIVYATTKYFGGHSDVLGGAVVVREDDGFLEKIRSVQVLGGAVLSPFDCWLTHRGIRTLPVRMRTHCENAARLAAFLNEQPNVEKVHYPGLPEHPQHEVARRQMNGFGGMLSFQVKGGADEARSVVSKVRLFTRATSLGGTESLIEHRAAVEGPGTRTPQNLLRLSVGLEHPDDLIEDLGRALSDG